MAGGYWGNKYYSSRYFPDNYFGTGQTNLNALVGSAAGVSTATGSLTMTGTPVVVEPPSESVGGGAAKRRRQTQPEPSISWRGKILEIRADMHGSCVVTADVVRQESPHALTLSQKEIEDDDQEVMAFIAAFMAHVNKTDRINGFSI